MKSFLIAVMVLCCVSTVEAWNLTMTEAAGTRNATQTTYNIVNECIMIDINQKTQIKVCKCGSVALQEWKEVVANKDQSAWDYVGPSIILTPNNDYQVYLTVPR